MADSNIEVKLKNVRLSFFNAFTPQERRSDQTKELVGYNYNTAILISKKDQADLIEQIKTAMRDARAAKWGDNPPRIAAERYCLRDGEPVDPDTNTPKALYEGYDGMMVLTANKPVDLETYDLIKKGEKARPVKIIGPRRNSEGKFVELKESSEFAPYSGCYGNVIVRIYAYDGTKNDHPHRINASLEAVQFNSHGQRFAGAAPVDVDSSFDEVDGFDEVEGGDTAGSSAGSSSGAAATDDLLG